LLNLPLFSLFRHNFLEDEPAASPMLFRQLSRYSLFFINLYGTSLYFSKRSLFVFYLAAGVATVTTAGSHVRIIATAPRRRYSVSRLRTLFFFINQLLLSLLSLHFAYFFQLTSLKSFSYITRTASGVLELID
jgi:hypothetical protein